MAWSANLVLDSGKKAVWEPWQLYFLSDVFSGVREAWLIVPEGNGKTTLTAALSLYHCENKLAAEVPIAAASREQAEILYKQAEGFVIRTPELHDTFECLPGYREIRCALTSGRIKVFAADQRTGDGIIPTLAISEEQHRQKDMGLYWTWTGKMDKRDGQIVCISVAGVPGSEFEQTRENIRQQGKVHKSGCFTRVEAPGLIMHEYAVPEDGDVEDLKLVKMANPSSRITIESLERKRRSPTWDRAHWERMVCNRPTRGGLSAITEEEWRRAYSDKRIPKGQPIWLGVDLAFDWDTTALVPYWQPSKESRYLGIPEVLVPPRSRNRQLSHEEIEAALRKIHARNPIEVVVIDPSKSEWVAAFCKKELSATVIPRQRSPGHAEIEYARFMESLRAGWLHHPGDPTLTRHVLNAITRMNPFGASRFDESHAARHENTPMQDTRVIDALSAASMVLAAANEDVPIEDKPKWRLLA